MSEALDFVKQNAEGKDLSVLPGSIKWVVDSQIVFMNPDNGEITDDDVEAACTITTDMETFKGMYDKSVSPQAAFMTGKLKVEGDMGIALKLQSVIN
ncbi:SCP2 sterol-binding domain-containing protein [Acidimicrobiaceae bacterium]|jgi:putative sterol carrier protein|nr:SCP2 sterol-binding domain-containing protein [Acidimicrobiaceae bacterium]MDA9713169.1 SCP2 sterol-binding domain-containing protein [Acidimicrobiaceae bacterium]|tara:strand:+ start:94 stop:384 length:291 start_codon:yes stop_codon:yes gene_type:complete